ncbi:MAG: METTL5 family protein [Candidatus Kariarchaeaceae archaeon]|jgi:putative methylase
MIPRKELEIHLSRVVKGFTHPKVELEQYQTPPRVAANIIHRAGYLGDIVEKNVVDLCAGTGILGIAAALCGASVTSVEIDTDCISILDQNCEDAGVQLNIQNEDVLIWEPSVRFDTALLNPPFGIQQKKYRDLEFVSRASSIADFVYSIHDGSETNRAKIPILLEKMGIEVIEQYLDEFPIPKIFPWHKLRYKIHKVLILKSRP